MAKVEYGPGPHTVLEVVNKPFDPDEMSAFQLEGQVPLFDGHETVSDIEFTAKYMIRGPKSGPVARFRRWLMRRLDPGEETTTHIASIAAYRPEEDNR